MSTTPTEAASAVAGTRVVVSSSPRTTVTPRRSISSTSGCATSTRTVSWPPAWKRLPKMLPIAPAPTTATFIRRPSLVGHRTNSLVRCEPAPAGHEAAVDDERLSSNEGTRLGCEELASADQLPWPARPSHRHAVHDPARDVRIGPDRSRERRVHVAGRDRVRPNAVLRPLERHHAR